MSCVWCVIWRWPVRARARAVGCGVVPIPTIRAANRLVGGRIACIRGPGSLSEHRGRLACIRGPGSLSEGASRSIGGALHAFEAQGASRSIGGPAPVVMPHLGEDFIGSVLQKADATSFETELNVGACELCVPGCVSVLSTGKRYTLSVLR